MGSLYMTVCVSVERYITLAHPYWYNRVTINITIAITIVIVIVVVILPSLTGSALVPIINITIVIAIVIFSMIATFIITTVNIPSGEEGGSSLFGISFYQSYLESSSSRLQSMW